MFFWDYSGIGILGIGGIYVLLRAIPCFIPEYHSVHSAPDSRMNRMEGMWFTRNRQNKRSFRNFWREILRGHLSSVCADIVVLRSPPIPFPDLKHVGAFFLN